MSNKTCDPPLTYAKYLSAKHLSGKVTELSEMVTECFETLCIYMVQIGSDILNDAIVSLVYINPTIGFVRNIKTWKSKLILLPVPKLTLNFLFYVLLKINKRSIRSNKWYM